MLINVFDQIWLIRRIKGGDWIKTQHRGWITFDTYAEYLNYGFDPIGLKYVQY